MLEIREALPSEWPDIGVVTQDAWREFGPYDDATGKEYFAFLGDVAARAARAHVLVAVDGGRVVGTATVELERTIEPDGRLAADQANFRMLAVAPEQRGAGIGRALVAQCLAVARAAGKARATLHTAPEMEAARHLYGEFGFRRRPEDDFEPGPGYRLLAYELEL